MDTVPSRTFQDLSFAIRRSWLLLVVLGLLGLIGGYLLGAGDTAYTSTASVRLRDATRFAESLGLPPETVTVLTPSVVRADFIDRQDELVPELPDEVTLSTFADDAAATLQITSHADTADDAELWARTAGEALVEHLRTDQQQRIDGLAQFHRTRLDAVTQQLASATSDTDRALLVSEQAAHMDALARLEELSASPVGGVEAPVVDEPESISSSPVVSSLAGLVVGLVLALVIIYVRLVGDRSIRKASDLEAATGMECLAVAGSRRATGASEVFTALASMISRRCPPRATLMVLGVDESTAATDVASELDGAFAALLGDERMTTGAVAHGLSTDPAVLHRAMEAAGVVLVARHGKTSGTDARAAARTLSLAGVPVLGWVLADVPSRELFWADDAGRSRPVVAVPPTA